MFPGTSMSHDPQHTKAKEKMKFLFDKLGLSTLKWLAMSPHKELQKDTVSCGIFVISYAVKYIMYICYNTQLNFDEQVFLALERSKIKNYLLNSSESLEGFCIKCLKEVQQSDETCVMCNRKIHLKCKLQSLGTVQKDLNVICFVCTDFLKRKFKKNLIN